MAQALDYDFDRSVHASNLIHCVSYGSVGELKSLMRSKADLYTLDSKGTPLIHYAVCNTQVLEFLLEEGSQVEARDSNGATPFLSCAYEGTLQNMRLLMAYGANIRARDKKGATALHYAAIRAKSHEMNREANVQIQDRSRKRATNEAAAIVDFLLMKGLLIETRDNLGRTPLHHCAEIGILENTKMLVEKGASIKTRSNRGSSVLHSAAANKNTSEILNFLLDQGLYIDARDELGFTPLHDSLWFQNLRNMKLLVERGADVDAKARRNLTALHMAAAYGQTTWTLQYLLEKGASINATTSEGITPLLTCACRGNLQKMKFLIEKGADILAEDESGLSSLHFAAANKETTHIMLYLLNQGMQIEAKDKLGRTPLLFSAAEGNLMTVSFLCERAANLKALDKREWTVLHHAATNVEGGPIIHYLLGEGVPVDARDNKGKTPLNIANMSGMAENERVLLRKTNSNELSSVASVTAMLRSMHLQMQRDATSNAPRRATS